MVVNVYELVPGKKSMGVVAAGGGMFAGAWANAVPGHINAATREINKPICLNMGLLFSLILAPACCAIVALG